MIVDPSIPQAQPLPTSGVRSSAEIVDHLDNVLKSQPPEVQAAVDHAHGLMGMSPVGSNRPQMDFRPGVDDVAQASDDKLQLGPPALMDGVKDKDLQFNALRTMPIAMSRSSDMADHQPSPRPSVAASVDAPAEVPEAGHAIQNPHLVEMERLSKNGAGYHQIKNPFLKALAGTADVIGSGLFPGFAQFVPGTSARNQSLIDREESQLGQEQKATKAADESATSTATQQHLNAESEELEHRGDREDAQAAALANNPDWTASPDPLIDPAHPEKGAQVAFISKKDPTKVQYVGAAAAKPTTHIQTDPKELYTEAIADAFKRGVDPSKDPKVQELASAITDIQRQPVAKEPQRDDKYIAIQAKPADQRTAEENAYVKGYEKYVHETKVQPGVVRMETMGNFREMPVLDTKNGNSPVFLSATEINAANQKEPGRYMPPGVGAPALTKTALIEDIRGNVQQVRDSMNAMPELSKTDRVKIALAMRSRDPKSAISALVSSGAIPDDPHLQDYLINLTNLHENAMAMRSVLGAGQGSEDLRSAITAVVPGPQTPNKAYGLKQLDVFEKTLDRLEKGIPKVNLRGGGESASQKTYTQTDVDAAVAEGHGDAKTIEAAFKAKGYVKK